MRKDAPPILIDCDGVLTDGRLHIDHTGHKLFKAFHTRDVRAIRELVFRGHEVYIVTADDWEGIKHFAEKVGAMAIIARDKGNVGIDNYIAVGDDAWDVPMLKRAATSYCPCDADQSVLLLPGIKVLSCRGGEGVIAALVSDLYANHNHTVLGPARNAGQVDPSARSSEDP